MNTDTLTQQEFFAKFVFCNNVDKPLIIDPGETRYWVREVPKLESDDVDFLSKIEKEIPHLMYHLLHERKMSVSNKGRMYFDPALLFTPALQRIMMNSRSLVEAAIYDLCDDILSSTGEESFSFVPVTFGSCSRTKASRLMTRLSATCSKICGV